MMLKAGFTDYLTKPVTLSEMEKMLLKYLPADKVLFKEKKEEAEKDAAGALPDKLKDIEEIDIGKGLEYCGDEEDYLDALDIFTSSAEDKANRLDEHLRSKDYENLSLLAHSVKSTSRAIGAGELSGLAAAIEAQAKNKDTESLKESVPCFTKEYRALGERLGAALDAAKKG